MSFYPEYGKSLNQFQKDSSYSISSFICSVCSSAKNNFPGSRTRIGLGHGLERNYNSADLKSKCNFIKNCNMAGFDAYATAAVSILPIVPHVPLQAFGLLRFTWGYPLTSLRDYLLLLALWDSRSDFARSLNSTINLKT
jgi:hypothetical protein